MIGSFGRAAHAEVAPFASEIVKLFVASVSAIGLPFASYFWPFSFTVPVITVGGLVPLPRVRSSNTIEMLRVMPVTMLPSTITVPTEPVWESPTGVTDEPPKALSMAPATAVVQFVPFIRATALELPWRFVNRFALPAVLIVAPPSTLIVLVSLTRILAASDEIGIALPAKLSVVAEVS
ncbi:hypothetical protein HPGCJGGD_3737 [Methylobacterium haplocladii]|nr:hypothetical protein HPGCJGGD_3737 [Methylobacterium haplocladii]